LKMSKDEQERFKQKSALLKRQMQLNMNSVQELDELVKEYTPFRKLSTISRGTKVTPAKERNFASGRKSLADAAKMFDFRKAPANDDKGKSRLKIRRNSLLNQTKKASVSGIEIPVETVERNRRRASVTAQMASEAAKAASDATSEISSRSTQRRLSVSAKSSVDAIAILEQQRIEAEMEDAKTGKTSFCRKLRRDLSKIVILPDSAVRLRWDFLILVLVVYYAFIIPLRLAELVDIPTSKDPGFYMDHLFTSIFLLDILLNSITAFRRDGIIILDRAEIFLNYARTWFLIDIIAVFPFEVFEGPDSQANQANKIIRLVRLFKLTRIFRVNRIATRAEDNVKVDTNTVRILKLVFVLVLFWHFIACAYWFTSLYEGIGYQNKYYNETGKLSQWVAPNELVTVGVYNTSEFRYILSVFWAVMGTMGNGRDVEPDDHIEIIISIVAIILGLGVYAVVIGGVTSALSNMDSIKTTRGRKLEGISEYLNIRQVPNDLKNMIREYYVYSWEYESNTGANPVLEELHDSLHLELNTFLYKEIIESVPVFLMIKNNDCILELIEKLQPRLCVPSEMVIREGTIGEECYIIAKGMMDVWKYNKENDQQVWVTRVPRKNVIGEASLLTRDRRNASVTSVGYTELLTLSRKDFDSVMFEYPELLRAMQVVASGKLQGWDRVRALIKSAKTMRLFGVKTNLSVAFNASRLTMDQQREMKRNRTALWKTEKGRESIFTHRLNLQTRKSVHNLLHNRKSTASSSLSSILTRTKSNLQSFGKSIRSPNFSSRSKLNLSDSSELSVKTMSVKQFDIHSMVSADLSNNVRNFSIPTTVKER